MGAQTPMREWSGILKEEERTNFFPLYILWDYITIMYPAEDSLWKKKKNPLANPGILKCKLWE